MDLETMRRQSGLRLDREGRILYQGKPLENDRVRQLFERGLEIDDAGELILRVGEQWAYVEVEETPFVVRRVRDLEDGGLMLVLNDESEERLAPETLWVGPDDSLYCHVKGGIPARLLRAAYHHVAHRLRETSGGTGYVFETDGETIPVPRGGATLPWRGRPRPRRR